MSVAVELASGGDSDFFTLEGAVDSGDQPPTHLQGQVINPEVVQQGDKPVAFSVQLNANLANYRNLDDDDLESYAAYMVHPSTKSVYTVTVLIHVDRDTQDDSGSGARGPDPQNSDPDNPDSDAAPNATDVADDRDVTLRVPVTVYVPKADPADKLAFATIPGMSNQDDLVLEDDDNATAKGVQIVGLPDTATVSAVVAGGDNADVFYGVDDQYEIIRIKYQGVPVPSDSTATTPIAANDYVNALSTDDAVLPGEVPVTLTVYIDIDTSVDSGGVDFDDDDGGVDVDGDGNPNTEAGKTVAEDNADDRDQSLTFTATIKLYEVMSLEEPASPAEAHGFSIRSSAAADTQVGVVDIIGARSDETIDIISNSAYFNVAPRRTGTGAAAKDMQAVITVKDGADLTSLIGSSETFTITANGAFVPTRTDAVGVKVSVTASNNEPDIIDLNYDFAAKVLEIPFDETETSADVLVEAEEELYDFGDSFQDDDTLRYLLTGADADQFSLDPSTGVLTVKDDDIEASVPTAALDEGEDDDETAADEEMVHYKRPPGDGGVFSNDENVTNAANDDVYYDLIVSASDRANVVPMAVELKIDANDRPTVDDTDANAEGVFEASYETTAPFGTPIFDVYGALNADEDAEDLDFDLAITGPVGAAPATFTMSTDGSGVIQLNFPGFVRGSLPDWNNTWDVTVVIDDGFVNTPISVDEDGERLVDDDDVATGERDVDAVVKVTIEVIEGDAPQRIPHSISVDEHTAVDTVVGSVAGRIDDVVEFVEVAGSTGSTHFNVVETGDDKGNIIIMSDLDADADNAVTTMLLSVKAFGENNIELGEISVLITIAGVNEAPSFDSTDDYARTIPENAQTGSEVGDAVQATDPESGDDITFSVKESGMPFAVETTENTDGSFSGQIKVDGTIAIRDSPYTITVVATDNGSPVEDTPQAVTITISDINDPPTFDAPVTLHMTIAENAAPGTLVATYNAEDVDGGDIIQGVEFVLRDADDVANFTIENVVDQVNDQISGRLTVAVGAKLEYDIEQDSPAPVTYIVEVNVCDAAPACNEIALIVTLENSDDEAPVIGNADDSQSVPENSARGTSLGDYSATDKDNLNDPGFDVTKYSLRGTHAKVFNISDTGELMTLAALDYDRINANGTRGVPCGSCSVTVVATDKDGTEDTQPVTISVLPVEDSVSTLDVTKANPVPGTEMGNPMSALAGTKVGSDEYLWNMLDCYEMKALVNSDDDSTYCKMWDGLSPAAQATVSAALGKDAEERPGDLPVTYGSAPMNFVQTEWANWGSVLRIAVTSESPDANCDNGNQCVVVNINSDSADDSLKLKAYRSGGRENEYVAAVMLVEESKHVTSSDDPVYMHGDALLDDDPNPNVLAPRLKVDEEDEIEVEFGNLRGSIDVENEAPEISNFAPEHESAFDDADVDYTFTVTDSLSGLPEPEDLPDVDGDENYTPVVALISENQCVTYANTETFDRKVFKVAAEIHEDETLYCRGIESDGEYIATEASSDFGFAPIRDDKDFDEIDDGFEVETTIVLAENEIFYVTFIACDNAGNCTFYDPDGNDAAEELAEITVDIDEPVFVEARTGLTWDSTDNEYDDNRSFIQVIFNDLTPLNTATVEIDDFVVEGHTIKDVHIFENPDDDDADWHPRYGAAGSTTNLRGIARYRDIENSVFLELEDELLADETPDVTIVPNGVEDKAGNEQDDGDHEADDWISPTFTVVSIVSTRETSQDEVLAGDDDEVTVVVTADERLDSTRPTVYGNLC